MYHPEIERLIRELTGAEIVLLFGPALRTDAPERAEGAPTRQQSACRFCAATGWCAVYFIRATCRVRREADRPRQSPFHVDQCVAAAKARSSASPLALADAATITRADLNLRLMRESGASPPSRAKRCWTLWKATTRSSIPGAPLVLFPPPRADELLVFKLCDSYTDAIQFTAQRVRRSGPARRMRRNDRVTRSGRSRSCREGSHILACWKKGAERTEADRALSLHAPSTFDPLPAALRGEGTLLRRHATSTLWRQSRAWRSSADICGIFNRYCGSSLITVACSDLKIAAASR